MPKKPAGARVGEGHVVLLVEDDEMMRELVAECLESAGYRVAVASTADAAYQAGQGEVAVDLLLCDLVMPGLDPMALAAQLRQSRPSLAVIFMSGYVEGSGPESSGADAFLGKPFSPTQVREAVARALKSRT